MGLHDERPRRALLPGLLTLFALFSATAGAQVDVVKNGPGNPDENVLFQAQQEVGNPVYGVTNNTAQQVRFAGEEDLIAVQAQGQSVLRAVDGAFNALCVDMDVAGNSMKFFTELEFTVDAVGDGTIAFDAYYVGGATPYSETLTISGSGVGQNRFNVIADPNVLLTKVCFTTNPDIVRAIQFRISPAQGGGPDIDEVPEPRSLALFAGAAIPLLGLWWRRR